MPPRSQGGRPTRKELERWARERDRERLRALSGAVKAARGTRRERTAAIRAACKAERERLRAEALEQLAKLRESIARMRGEARKLCAVRLDDTRRETGEAIARAVAALGEEVATQQIGKAWRRPAFCPVPKGARRGEARAESDCEVAQNITEAALLPVWEQVKHKIKGNSRRSRTEAFLEWVHDHAAQVAELQEKAEQKAIDALIREEERTRERLSVGYRRTSDRELEKLAAGSTVEALPVQREPPRSSVRQWIGWLATGAGPLRRWSYQATHAGAEDLWFDRGDVQARNGLDAARAAAEHLLEHHGGDQPFPAWIEVTDLERGASLPFYARSPGEVFYVDAASDDRAMYATEADRLRREDAALRAEVGEPAEPPRKARKRAPRRAAAESMAPPPF